MTAFSLFLIWIGGCILGGSGATPHYRNESASYFALMAVGFLLSCVGVVAFILSR